LGVIVFQLIIILQEGIDYLNGLMRLNLRDLSYEGRVTLIKEQVKDVAFRELLFKMLDDDTRRPDASELLENESVMFNSYLLEETDTDLR
jgi:hypothetical protein